MDGKASIWVGEFKSKAISYAAAKDRLKKALALYAWVVQVVRPQTTTVVKTGKVYMPKAEAAGRIRHEIDGDILFVTVGVE